MAILLINAFATFAVAVAIIVLAGFLMVVVREQTISEPHTVSLWVDEVFIAQELERLLPEVSEERRNAVLDVIRGNMKGEE